MKIMNCSAESDIDSVYINLFNNEIDESKLIKSSDFNDRSVNFKNN